MHATEPLTDGQLCRYPEAGGQTGVKLQRCLAQTPLPPTRAQLQLQIVQTFTLLLQLECGQAADQRFGISGPSIKRICR
ncbi:hypothetical protein D3C72_1716010 [compost metagenome]